MLGSLFQNEGGNKMSQFLDEMERIKTIRIGEKAKPTFSKEEMANRNAK